MIVKRNGKWLLLSKTDPKKILGEHETEAEAIAQEKAINASKRGFSIPDVEVFAAGTHNGETYTETDIDAMVSAFGELDYQPPLKVGHQNKPGMPAAGWVTNLRRKGEKLIADFVDVAEPVYHAILDKSYNTISSEVFWDFQRGEKTYHRALKAVAILGADIPAVAGLTPLHEMFSDIENIHFIRNPQAEGNPMSEDIKKYEAANAKLKADLEAAERKAKEYAEKLAEAGKSKTGDEAKQYAEKMKVYETELADLRKARISDQVSAKVEKVSIPALRPHMEALYGIAYAEPESKVYAIKSGDKGVPMVSVVDGVVAQLNDYADKLFAPYAETGKPPEKTDDDKEISNLFATAINAGMGTTHKIEG